jgi:glyceraldehyde-3-phosphate dehydrogenase type I
MRRTGALQALAQQQRSQTMRIAINGFGRIGRQAFRIAWGRAGIDVVHLNDITDARTLAHLLKYDSTYGLWDHDVSEDGRHILIDGKPVPVTAEKDPANLPWRHQEVDVVLESTGAFRKRAQAQQHLDAGAKKVLVSAPGKDALDGNFVLGVNEEAYNRSRHHIISIGSCTTNCLAPLAKVLHDEFVIVHGLMTTIHAYTASQNLLDGPHKDLKRARAAAENIIPTSTGAAKSIGDIMPELAGKLDGMALRVPVACGSILDLTCQVQGPATSEAVNEAVRRHSEGRMKGIVQIAPAPLVSRDIVGNSHSAVFIPEETRMHGSQFVKVLAWYDNEWGFSCRLVDMMKLML